MGRVSLNRRELEVQSHLEEGKIEEAKKALADAGNQIRLVYRAIFEASIGLAEGDLESAWKAVSAGLQADGRHYELYMLLGDCYAHRNLRQAYLCYENALFYCDVPEDAEQIKVVLEELNGQGVSVPKTAIVILSYNLLSMTRECVESIRRTTPEGAREIIVVDNASADGSVEWLRRQKDITLLCNTENKGFPVGCNQGIMLAGEEHDVFLLNNDTVVTDNALFWLRMGLYEGEGVGSTGCVTNHVSNFQTVIEDGKSREEYLAFARKTNVPMEYPYLNKVYLVGFALLIKRTVLDRIGLLDERFSPGNFEDNDLCLRIALAGFRNVLCKNSFIIHWGSSSFGKEARKFNNVLEINRRKFFEKWSSVRLEESVYGFIRMDLVSLLETEKNSENDAVMVVGTGYGELLSAIKDKFPAMQVYGMEQNPHMAGLADRIADTVCVNLDDWNGEELAETFDIIIINDALECAKNPEAALKELAKMLKKDGKCIICFRNGQHFSRIEKENITGTFLTRNQMEEIFQRAKLSGGLWSYTQLRIDETELMRIMGQMQERYPSVDRNALAAYQWLTVAEKQRTDIQFHRKMAVYIPTYKHPEVVEDVLSHCAEVYKRYTLDVYYFDSSDDDETKKVVEGWRKRGYDNLYYVKVDSSKPVIRKFEDILLVESVKRGYEYMWWLRDRCWCEERTLKLMHRAMEGRPDLIFFDFGHPNNPEELTYCNDADAFYHRCGDYATSMDAAIYSVEAFFAEGYNLEELHQKYGDGIKHFLHVIIIFERLAKMESLKVCLLSGRNMTVWHSQKGGSGWYDHLIDIWGKSWIQVNEALPDCYSDKDDVIKRTASFPWLLGNMGALIDLHKKGILTPKYFEEIKGFWERVSNIPLDTLRKIAYGERG